MGGTRKGDLKLPAKHIDLKQQGLATEASGQNLNSLDGERVVVCLRGCFSLHPSGMLSSRREVLAMSIKASAIGQGFVRRTVLNPNEYRTNFRQIDCDVIETLISDEASKVTPHMSKIYLTFVNAPSSLWEREGVLRLIGCEREEGWLTAWEQLVEMVGVASATARKAIAWMNQQGIIGYHAGKNGVGIRIFINRAASSIRQKPDQVQKNLRLVRASTDVPRTSTDEVPFKESFAVLENSDSDLISPAPETGAADENDCKEISTQNTTSTATAARPKETPPEIARSNFANAFNSIAIVERIVREVVPQVKAAATREQERTRDWFINHALPKAIRVAQASAYDVLRAHGAIEGSRSRAVGGVGGRNHSDNRQVGKHIPTEITPRLLSVEEITELAQGCAALLVTQGQTIDRSLSEMSVEAGGFLLPEDAPKVRAKAESLVRAGATAQSERREDDDC